jgi:PAS domain S-box-containing protein
MACKSNSIESNGKSTTLVHSNLALLQDLLQKIIDSSDKRVLIISNNEIVHANPCALAELGYSKKDFIKSKIDAFIVSPQGGGQVGNYLGVGVNLKKKGLEFDPIKLKRFDGKVVQYKLNTHRCFWNGKSSVLVMLKDFTPDSNTSLVAPDFSSSKKLALTSSSIFFWDYNLSTQTLTMDPKFFQQLKTSVLASENTIESWIKVQTSESRNLFEKIISCIKSKKNTHYQWEYKVTDSDSNPHQILASVDVVEWDNLGNPLRIAGVHTEIENRATNNIKGNRLVTSLSGFIQNSLDGLVMIDLDGRIQEWNPAQEKLTQIKRDDAIGKHIWVLQHSLSPELKSENDFVTQINTLFEGITKDGANTWDGNVYETKIRVTPENTKVLQHSVFTVDTEQGQMVVITNRDITESKLSLERIEKSEERLKLALAASRVGIWDEDHISGEKYYSPMMYAILGYRPLEVEPSEEIWAKHIHPEDLDLVNQKNRALIASGTNLEMEFRIIRKDNEIIWVQSKTQVIRDERNKTIRITGTVSDITRQKTIESELRRNEEILKRNILQHEVVANISFILNTNKPIDEKINNVLRALGEFTQASRVYIFENKKDKEFTANTYEWCNQGINPQKEMLQEVPLSLVYEWMGTEPYKMSRNLSQELSRDFATILVNQEIESLIVFRLFISGHEFGFIGFDECGYRRIWSQPEVDLLKTISNLISFAFEREAILHR